jgi:hypothetical protein
MRLSDMRLSDMRLSDMRLSDGGVQVAAAVAETCRK